MYVSPLSHIANIFLLTLFFFVNHTLIYNFYVVNWPAFSFIISDFSGRRRKTFLSSNYILSLILLMLYF